MSTTKTLEDKDVVELKQLFTHWENIARFVQRQQKKGRRRQISLPSVLIFNSVKVPLFQ